MDLIQVIKNQEFFQKLVEKKEKNTLSNANLFFCEDNITSEKTLILTALLLQYKTFELLNESSAEFVRIESGVDLDVKVFPKNNEKLLVSDSNDIVSESFVKPVNLPNKIFIIKNFESSTEEAQNKLLKILEEPPQNVYFLISAKNEERILPTILSRCDKIKINPLSIEEISKYSKDKLAIALGGGYVGKTLSLERNENLRAISAFAVSLLCELKSSKQVIKYSTKFLDYRIEINQILEVLALAIEDVIKIKCESEKICRLQPFLSELKDVEPEFSVEALCEISKLITNFREKLEFNANLTVAIDNFLLKMLEVKFLCK